MAHNSTLGDVLKAVRQQTGAELDIPPNASERVVADLGPGPARDVIAQLLNGTHFNYVMVGSATDPTAVQSIVLTPKPGLRILRPRPPSQPPERPQRSLAAWLRLLPRTRRKPWTTPVPMSRTDRRTGSGPKRSQNQQNQQNPSQQTPKTPEQLLQELQRQQQQQQQQQNRQAWTAAGILPNQPPTDAPPNKPEKPIVFGRMHVYGSGIKQSVRK